jgi:parallel beta-helix repeat protein/predicted outer membrane repeat protein
VTVSNGTYDITSELLITTNITVRSYGNGVTGGLANAAATIVQRSSGSIRIFNITGGAVVDGFTIRNGSGVSDGAGVYLNHVSARLQNCIVSNNTANYGGGVYVYDGTASNCVIRNNSASYGGAVSTYAFATVQKVVDCRIYGNSASEGGGYGAGGNNYSGIEFLSCIFSNNTATGNGGGLHMGHAKLRNCLIVTNTASGSGGGVFIEQGNGTLQNCTIVGNTANGTDGGGGVLCGFGSSPNVGERGYIDNCIVYDNLAPNNTTYKNIRRDPAGSYGWKTTYTCTKDPAWAAVDGNISADPKLQADYTLKPGQSPCIDAGYNAYATWTTDLAGNARKIDGNKDTVVTVDMGAYEAPPPPPSGTVILLR